MNNILTISTLKIYLRKIILTSFITTTVIFSSGFEYESDKISGDEFLLELSKNDFLYEKYDSPINQFDIFFGLRINYDSDDQINFGDLSITVDSKNIRDLYIRKLKNMTNNNYKYTNSFYKEKL